MARVIARLPSGDREMVLRNPFQVGSCFATCDVEGEPRMVARIVAARATGRLDSVEAAAVSAAIEAEAALCRDGDHVNLVKVLGSIYVTGALAGLLVERLSPMFAPARALFDVALDVEAALSHIARRSPRGFYGALRAGRVLQRDDRYVLCDVGIIRAALARDTARGRGSAAQDSADLVALCGDIATAARGACAPGPDVTRDPRAGALPRDFAGAPLTLAACAAAAACYATLCGAPRLRELFSPVGCAYTAAQARDAEPTIARRIPTRAHAREYESGGPESELHVGRVPAQANITPDRRGTGALLHPLRDAVDAGRASTLRHPPLPVRPTPPAPDARDACPAPSTRDPVPRTRGATAPGARRAAAEARGASCDVGGATSRRSDSARSTAARGAASGAARGPGAARDTRGRRVATREGRVSEAAARDHAGVSLVARLKRVAPIDAARGAPSDADGSTRTPGTLDATAVPSAKRRRLAPASRPAASAFSETTPARGVHLRWCHDCAM